MQNTGEPVGCTALYCIYIVHTGAVTLATAVVALRIGCFANNML